MIVRGQNTMLRNDTGVQRGEVAGRIRVGAHPLFHGLPFFLRRVAREISVDEEWIGIEFVEWHLSYDRRFGEIPAILP